MEETEGGQVIVQIERQKEALEKLSDTVGTLEKRLGEILLLSPNITDVSDEEIQEHMASESLPRQYQLMDKDPKFKARVRYVVRRRVAEQKLWHEKDLFISDLWTSATIEILDERLR